MKERVQRQSNHAAGEGTNLWIVLTAPTIWALHFLLVYPGVAIYCAKVGRGAALAPMQPAVFAASAIAIAVIGAMFWRSWRIRQPSLSGDNLTFEVNSPEERHRFLTHLSLTLCALSIVGVIYVTLPVVFVESCR